MAEAPHFSSYCTFRQNSRTLLSRTILDHSSLTRIVPSLELRESTSNACGSSNRMRGTRRLPRSLVLCGTRRIVSCIPHIDNQIRASVIPFVVLLFTRMLNTVYVMLPKWKRVHCAEPARPIAEILILSQWMIQRPHPDSPLTGEGVTASSPERGKPRGGYENTTFVSRDGTSTETYRLSECSQVPPQIASAAQRRD